MNRSPTDILLGEDQPDDAELLKRALAGWHPDASVTVIDNGLDALRQLTSEDPAEALTPKLIILDLNLPGLDGMQLLRCITSNARTARIPVIMLSSSCSPEDVGASRHYGAKACMRKPFSGGDMDRLGELVARQLH